MHPTQHMDHSIYFLFIFICLTQVAPCLNSLCCIAFIVLAIVRATLPKQSTTPVMDQKGRIDSKAFTLQVTNLHTSRNSEAFL